MTTVTAAGAEAVEEDIRHTQDCVICAGQLGSKGGTLTLLCGM